MRKFSLPTAIWKVFTVVTLPFSRIVAVNGRAFISTFAAASA